MLEMGPVSKVSDHISYGFLLWGGGDVWLYDPKLEIVTDATTRSGDIAIIGSDESQPLGAN
jgi:hypothetical protein